MEPCNGARPPLPTQVRKRQKALVSRRFRADDWVRKSANTIRTALGLLQDDPDHEQAYVDLKEALANGKLSSLEGGMSIDDARALLAAARRAHEARREHDAVASLLELEVLLA